MPFFLKGNSLKFLKYWFPVILYCCMIFGVSAMPNLQLKGTISFSDKIVHMFEYAVLAVLFARAVAASSQRSWGLLIWTMSVAFIAFYGITDEFHQSFIIGRSSDLSDWIADLIGGSLGAAVYLVWLKVKDIKMFRRL